ncbi:ABC transporter permease [Halanaerobiaceae bacterium Z-7014]|uniref:ABC transporter permease n=1 Tax=Halonatronomonas betaini TaxID=2778430 RepID=A0A931AS78_9FIRM|nr:ABC transporter permease [Halonatronomonas betaini]MBF8438048.1 ABC transporter permease [Halonatronomonas betaini]
MHQYLFRRLLQGVPVILIVSLVVFIIINMAPGDPIARLEDPSISREDLEQRYAAMGLDDPLMVRYASWLGDFVRGDFGYSMDSSRQPVANLIRVRIMPTIYLTLGAMILSFIISIPIGILSATKQYSVFDYAATLFAFFGVSIPSFFFGLILLYVFALQLDLMPTGGFQDPTAATTTVWTHLHHAILPVIALGYARAASLTRYMRSSMLEVIKEDYVRTARAKGVKERVVVYKHALRNALIPVITILGLQVPLLFSGAVIIEEVFSWPGIGRLSIRAVWQRNYTVMMATTVIFAILVFFGNLIADMFYVIVDPRIKYD